MSFKAIAIDGPSGAGKSTIAKAAATKLSFIYVDTGALYRAIGYYMASINLDTKEANSVASHLNEVNVELRHINGSQRVFLNAEDVSDKIRTPDMAMHASNVSAIKEVRDFLFDLQQNIAKTNNVIMDGRDIGTVVLPNADVKIFLTASAVERANRRLAEHIAKGENIDFDTLLKNIEERDYNDSHRAIAPLKQADDAILVDTTGNDLDKSILMVLKIIEEKLK